MIPLFFIALLIGGLAFLFSFLPQTLIPFFFSSPLLLNQHFLLPQFTSHYFYYVGAILAINGYLCYSWPKKLSFFSMISSVLILLSFNPLLSIYLILTVFFVFLLGRHLNLTVSPFRQFFCLWILWAIWVIGVPWLVMFYFQNLDGCRLIFLHSCSLKVGTYLYDTLIQKKQFSLAHTWHFFLLPIHFFILPSWIVCPFPSEFKPLVIHKINLKRMRWAIKKLMASTLYLSIALCGSIGYLYLTENRLFHHSDYASLPLLSLISVNSLSGLLCFFYFGFIGYSIQAFYGVFGFKMTSPIFNKPYLTQNIFDFWNRILIQTKQVFLTLFFMPAFNFLRKFLPSVKTTLFVSILIMLFIMDIPLHILGTHRIQHVSFTIFEWYFALLGMMGLYYLSRRITPYKFRLLFQTRLGKMSKTVFWISCISFFY